MSKKIRTAEERLSDLMRELVADRVQEVSLQYADHLTDAASEGESPIEQLMAVALFHAVTSHQWFGDERNVAVIQYRPNPPFEEYRNFPILERIEICPQMPVGKYRADFIVKFARFQKRAVFGAIECDGHDHHDLTKEQASRDRERDRYFQEVGLIILRYPGSEIWRSPLKCAVDALSILDRRLRGIGG